MPKGTSADRSTTTRSRLPGKPRTDATVALPYPVEQPSAQCGGEGVRRGLHGVQQWSLRSLVRRKVRRDPFRARLGESSRHVRREHARCHGSRDRKPGCCRRTPVQAPSRRHAQNFTIVEVSGDKAYLSEENIQAVFQAGGIPYILFKENSTGASAGSSRSLSTFTGFTGIDSWSITISAATPNPPSRRSRGSSGITSGAGRTRPCSTKSCAKSSVTTYRA